MDGCVQLVGKDHFQWEYIYCRDSDVTMEVGAAETRDIRVHSLCGAVIIQSLCLLWLSKFSSKR